MTPVRSIVDLLAEQPDDALVRMRDAAKAELARLTVEVQQIEQAMAKKSRRSGAGSGRLTKEQVFEVVTEAGAPLKPAQVHAALAEAGMTTNANSVRNHLRRLQSEGRLIRLDDGRYAPPPSDFTRSDFAPAGAAAADDDIPF